MQSPRTAAFQRLVARLDQVVVTAVAGDGERSGCLVGFSTQCSIDPPHYLVAIFCTNHTHDVAAGAPHLGVHFLTQRHRDVATLFGATTGDELDKFTRCDWEAGPGGLPLLRRCRGWFVGEVRERLAAGDHTVMVLDVVAAQGTGDAAPGEGQLGFQAVRDLEPGHDH